MNPTHFYFGEHVEMVSEGLLESTVRTAEGTEHAVETRDLVTVADQEALSPPRAPKPPPDPVERMEASLAKHARIERAQRYRGRP